MSCIWTLVQILYRKSYYGNWHSLLKQNFLLLYHLNVWRWPAGQLNTEICSLLLLLEVLPTWSHMHSQLELFISSAHLYLERGCQIQLLLSSENCRRLPNANHLVETETCLTYSLPTVLELHFHCFENRESKDGVGMISRCFSPLLCL